MMGECLPKTFCVWEEMFLKYINSSSYNLILFFPYLFNHFIYDHLFLTYKTKVLFKLS